MIRYIVAADNEDNYNRFLKPSLEKIEALDRVTLVLNKDLDEGIFKKYNLVLNMLSSKGKINDEDVFVFVHDDVSFEDENLEGKIELYFRYKDNIGIAGVIGTTIFPAEGGWWMCDRSKRTRGRIIQGHPDQPDHVMEDKKGMFDDLVSVDGCILFMSGRFLKDFRFDEQTYDGYHFYDVDSCFTALRKGFSIGIIDVLVRHESEGPLSDSWFTERDKFIKKWTARGMKFPILREHLYQNINS